MGFLLACSHSDDHLLSNRRLPNWKSGIPLPIFSEWWLFNDKFSAIDSFVLSSFPGAMFQGMNGLSVKYQVLDLVLGHGDDLFRLAQSKALVSIHDLEAGKGGELTHDNDYSGALNLTEKTAKEAMTPIESRLCLDVDSKLDWAYRFEHCGAVPLESCTSLFMSCQQCFKEAHWETGKSLPLKCTPIRFGSWMGGGRDGNPNVTAKVTKDVSLLSRWMTIDLYIREVDSLKFELSMNWCSNSLSKLAQEILEHSMTYCSYFQWSLILATWYHVETTKA